MLSSLVVALIAASTQAQTPQQPLDPFDQKLAAVQSDDAQLVAFVLETCAQLPHLPGDVGRRQADALEPLLQRALFSGKSVPRESELGVALHTVQPGELPSSIAKKYGIGAGLLRYMNAGYDERRIAAGRKLRVLDLSNRSLQVIVDKERHRVGAWYQTPGGQWSLALYAKVGLGASSSPTPSGTTSVIDRVRNPAWTDPKTREVYKHGDERNVLGGYWMKLDEATLGVGGIGFHGYTGAPTPDWIEKDASNGCIRMLQPDIDRVFELALEGTKVVIAP